MIDIQEGDTLVVGGTEYPVRGVARWTNAKTTLSFKRLAVVDASTKRNPASVNGKRGVPETHLTGLKITPLDSVSADQVKFRDDLKSPFKVYRTYLSEDNEFVELTIEDLA
jgi:hypothetical protein